MNAVALPDDHPFVKKVLETAGRIWDDPGNAATRFC
jgi:hypothetical protein